MTKEITVAELFWLVGMFEGEGCFQFDGTQRVVFVSTDEDICYKVADIVSRIVGEKCNVLIYHAGHHKLQYRVRLAGGKARLLMRTLVPHMGYRRRRKIWQSLNNFVEKEIDFDLMAALNVEKRNG